MLAGLHQNDGVNLQSASEHIMKSGSFSTPETAVHRRLRKLYDQLWASAIGRIRAGTIEQDPVLKAGLMDQRRGLTLIARPSQTVRKSVVSFIRELRRVEPDQYYYSPFEIHLTVLSMFTATSDYKRYLRQQDAYLAAVDEETKGIHPFRIRFEGITASPSAIMVQGFFETEELRKLRNTLRHQLRVRGLSEGLDARYRLQTAHMTVARFRAPLRNSQTFANVLEGARRKSFGTTKCSSLLLVQNDWYMSKHTTVPLKRYALPSMSPNCSPTEFW
jgi:2'-5' RNA ligase